MGLKPLFLRKVCGDDELLLTVVGCPPTIKQISMTLLLHMFANLIENGISEDLSYTKDCDGTCGTAFTLAYLIIKADVSDSSKLLI